MRVVGHASSRIRNVTIDSTTISAGKIYLGTGAYISSVELKDGSTTDSIPPTLNMYSGTISKFEANSLGSVFVNNAVISTFVQNNGIFNIGSSNIIYGGSFIGSALNVTSTNNSIYNITKFVGNGLTPNKMVISIVKGGVISGLSVHEEIGNSNDPISIATSTNAQQQYGIVIVSSGGTLYNTQMTNIIVSNGGLVSGVNPVKVTANGSQIYAGKIYIRSGGTALGVPADFITSNVVTTTGANLNGEIK